MYMVCLKSIKEFKCHESYIWYNIDFIDMDIKYYSIRNRRGEFVGYLNIGQINSNFSSMYNWNRADREVSRIFHDLMDGKCVL
jgi:hypothetical protein